MNCPNCHQPVEAGAAFCGNCGFSLAAAPPVAPQPNTAPPAGSAATATAPINPNPVPTAAPATPQPANGVPSYALATPAQHAGETKALLSVIFGMLGLVGSLFLAIFGLFLGMLGIVMGTMSRSSPKRGLSTTGLVLSSLSVLAGLALIVYAVTHDPTLKNKVASHSSTPAVTTTASSLSTPCYSVGFVDRLRVSNAHDSCEMQAFDGQTLEESGEIYKIYATHSSVKGESDFDALAKSSIEKDIKANLASFTIDNEAATHFAGSAAYVVNVSNAAQKVAAVEAAVLHQTPTGDNFFVLVHAVSGATTDLQTLESQWHWK